MKCQRLLSPLSGIHRGSALIWGGGVVCLHDALYLGLVVTHSLVTPHPLPCNPPLTPSLLGAQVCLPAPGGGHLGGCSRLPSRAVHLLSGFLARHSPSHPRSLHQPSSIQAPRQSRRCQSGLGKLPLFGYWVLYSGSQPEGSTQPSKGSSNFQGGGRRIGNSFLMAGGWGFLAGCKP